MRPVTREQTFFSATNMNMVPASSSPYFDPPVPHATHTLLQPAWTLANGCS